jgi:UDP-glucose 4-epimerase
MHILITGGAGFIGSHLSERLLATGNRVTVLDNLSTGSVSNLAEVADDPSFDLVEGTILDCSLVRRLVARCDAVVHLAAAVGVRYVLDHPLETVKTNVHGTDVVLSACASEHKKVLVASTSEVYGKNSGNSLCETDDSVLGASSLSRWSYATSKKLDEFLALAYAASYNFPVILTRFFNIVGPRQASRYGMVLPNFVRSALENKAIRVFGDGAQTRNFTSIHDCIDALLLLLDSPDAAGEAFNIGGPDEISILNLARRVVQVTRSASPVVFVPYAQAYPEGGFEDMRRRVPCTCKIERMTGWHPRRKLDEVIAEVAAHELQGGHRYEASMPAQPCLVA